MTGRRGVGRGTVALALARAGVVVTDPADADLVVRVLADAVKAEDRAEIHAERRPVLAVLNKADLIATTAPGRSPDGPTAAARARCVQLADRAGFPVEPLVGLLAVAEFDEAAWQALADGDGRRLIPALDEFGVRQATAAIRSGADSDEVAALLRALSGIDAVVDKIDRLGASLRYQRVCDAVAELEVMAVTDQRIGEFLTCDDTVVARMTAAIDAVEADGLQVDRGSTAAAHLNRAAQWQRRRRAPGIQRACGADIVRGSLRLWSKVGGSA